MTTVSRYSLSARYPIQRSTVTVKRNRLISLAVLVAMLGVLAILPLTASAAPSSDNEGHNALRNIPVTGSNAAGDQFTGRFSISSFVEQNGQLFAQGKLNGQVRDASGHPVQAVNNYDAMFPVQSMDLGSYHYAAGQAHKVNGLASLSSSESRQIPIPTGCTILNLVLGPLQLNLLGLVVTIPTPVTVNITAVPGNGNLLGNLLCAVANLLNPGATLTQITAFLNALVALLNALP